MTVSNKTIDQLSVDTIRTLSIDAIEKAKSGHPGMPMGAAPMGYELFAKLMKHNPDAPTWVNRDRFVLSAGHGSMLLYSLLHLSGYDLSMDELKNFRQWGSRTPGHPEVGHTPGVDATTGPLGQGFGMAVGMAMAEAHLAAVYNRDQFQVIDHYTYAICGDGDLMEGLSSEAASLAGHLKLGKLIVLYDSNDISLDGELNLSFSENVARRFDGYGWQVLRVEDGNDLGAIHQAVLDAQADYRPTLIEVKTVIGYGSPNKAGKGGHVGPHGSPLGVDEVALTKKAYGWDETHHFHVPDEVRAHFADVKRRNVSQYEAWNEQFAAYAKAYPELAKQFQDAVNGDLPEGWDEGIPADIPADKGTRTASGIVLNAIAQRVPSLIGGSADLESSTMTHMKGLGMLTPKDYSGRNVYFGVREFGMGAAVNGMLLHGGLKVFGGTFFVFSDYLRPAIRLASIMDVPAIYVFTHDSIGVGEDGPTHEPIEQLAALRVIPGITVIRPADGSETAAAWKYAVANKRGPSPSSSPAKRRRSWKAPRTARLSAALMYWPKRPAASRRRKSSLPARRCSWPLRRRSSWPKRAYRCASSACRAGNCSISNRKSIKIRSSCLTSKRAWRLRWVIRSAGTVTSAIKAACSASINSALPLRDRSSSANTALRSRTWWHASNNC